MALQKRSVIVENNGGVAQSVFEHQIFKMLLPALAFILVGIVSWLFNTVLELDEKVQTHNVQLEHLHEAEEDFGKQMEDLTKIITDIRINVGRLTAH
jgi:peptidoglycan hydrolase CwlO-like protein